MPPIIIFAYLRHDLLESMIGSLLNCNGYAGRAVYVFQDGLKLNATDEQLAQHKKTSEVIKKHANNLWNVVFHKENFQSFIKMLEATARCGQTE